ncbi:hypothetical phage protein [Citrobacter phage CR8]|uniref:Hypothetical phage protein n=1 Tax=Citrobacter phage CR8 TaxID=1455076 RepID=W6Q7C8_9CAUD|nr:hypothetical protein CF79_gp01 [Citrobacter phage CR8]CDM21586.1 hypothetical phage protein [Citrobacter phage CR8]
MTSSKQHDKIHHIKSQRLIRTAGGTVSTLFNNMDKLLMCADSD